MFGFTLSSIAKAQLKKGASSVEGITECSMENGLKVLLFPDYSAQTITVNITYMGGRHEGYGEKGMAHLLVHLLFKDPPNHPNLLEELSSHGAKTKGDHMV